MQFVKNNLLAVMVIFLGAIILLQRFDGCATDKPGPTITVVHDTIYHTIHDTTAGKTKSGKTIHDTTWKHDTLNIPSTDYNELLAQYDALGDKYFSKHTYVTDYSLGKYGNAKAYDTIVSNNIVKSSLTYDIVIPETSTTTTIHEPYIPKNQLYMGGGIAGSQKSLLSIMDVGLLFKNKKDQIFGVKVGMGIDGVPVYGVQSYWKIKLKK